jgi:hypothetical protein
MVFYLLLLKIQLFFIVHVLPAASAAKAEMDTGRFGSKRRVMVKIDNPAFEKRLLSAGYLDVDDIAGNSERDEYDPVICAGHCFAFSTGVDDLQLF